MNGVDTDNHHNSTIVNIIIIIISIISSSIFASSGRGARPPGEAGRSGPGGSVGRRSLLL